MRDHYPDYSYTNTHPHTHTNHQHILSYTRCLGYICKEDCGSSVWSGSKSMHSRYSRQQQQPKKHSSSGLHLGIHNYKHNLRNGAHNQTHTYTHTQPKQPKRHPCARCDSILSCSFPLAFPLPALRWKCDVTR